MAPITYGSVCSGIEGASVAWAPLGWRCAFMAEIEAFPRAVLKHHYPDVPLFSDFTHLRDGRQDEVLATVDVLVGGTPCQGFSVAGLRGSLSDDRSNLCLEFIRLANAIDDLRRAAGRPPVWILWENVPGVFSTDDNAFGAFLGGLVGGESALDAGPRGRWTDAGVVAGPARVAAWRVLDAQHFGLAQRRRRVFVLALGGAGAWRCADALLPISDSLQGYPAPSRQTRERTAPTISARASAGGGLGTDAEVDGALIAAGPPVARALNAHPGGMRIDGESETFITHALDAHSAGGATEDGTGRGVPLVAQTAPALTAAGGTERKHGHGWGQQEYQQEGFLVPVAHALRPPSKGAVWRGDGCDDLVAHTLTADGFDASEDGTGRGPPLVPIGFNWQNGGGYGEANDGLAIVEDGVGPLDARQIKAVAFTLQDSGSDATDDLAPTLRAGNFTSSHANGGVMPAVAIPISADALRGEGTALTPSADAEGRVRLRDPGLGIGQDGDPADTLQASGPGAVAFALRGREGGAMPEVHDQASALRAASGGSSRDYVAFTQNSRDEVREQGDGEIAGSLAASSDGVANQRTFVAFDAAQMTHAANHSNPKAGDPAPPLASTGQPMVASVDLQNTQLGGELAGTLDTSRPSRGGGQAVAFNITPSQGNKDYNARPTERSQALTGNGNRPSARGGDLVAGTIRSHTRPGSNEVGSVVADEATLAFTVHGSDQEASTATETDVAMALRACPPGRIENASTTVAMQTAAVRRLTPTECERLQGFPDGYTDVPYRGKPAADGPRYKALGNSFAAPVIRWIGEQVARAERAAT